jgi:hypothetical protein
MTVHRNRVRDGGVLSLIKIHVLIGENGVFIGLTRKIIFRPLLRPDSFLNALTNFGLDIRFQRLLGVKNSSIPFLPNLPNHKARSSCQIQLRIGFLNVEGLQAFNGVNDTMNLLSIFLMAWET